MGATFLKEVKATTPHTKITISHFVADLNMKRIYYRLLLFLLLFSAKRECLIKIM